MTIRDLGPVGVVSPVASDDGAASALDAMAEVEELGFSTIWMPGGQGDVLRRVSDVVGATRSVTVASGIISVNRFPSDAVAATYAKLESAHPGRFVVGLGGAHGPQPLRTLTAYADRLDTEEPRVPAGARVFAAFGPRMLELARDRGAGALPYLVTPEYTARARATLGDRTALIVQLSVVLDADPDRARATARGPLGFFRTLPHYAASFRRQGFTDDDIATSSDRMVDSLVAWGDVDAIAERVRQYLAAGADQVALGVSAGSGGGLPRDAWRQLAGALLP